MRCVEAAAVGAALLSIVATMVPASAAVVEVFDWTISGASDFDGYLKGPSGSGTLTAKQKKNGDWIVQNITGTLDGVNVKAKPGNAFNADNLIFPNGPDLVDLQGLTFKLADGTKDNIFAPSNVSALPPDIYVVFERDPFGAETSETVRFTLTAAVPEPSTWAMMLLGFLGVGFLAYRRRNQTPELTAA
jgi:hypothetical protein